MKKKHVIYLQMNELGVAKEDVLCFSSHVDVDGVYALCISRFEEQPTLTTNEDVTLRSQRERNEIDAKKYNEKEMVDNV